MTDRTEEDDVPTCEECGSPCAGEAWCECPPDCPEIRRIERADW